MVCMRNRHSLNLDDFQLCIVQATGMNNQIAEE